MDPGLERQGLLAALRDRCDRSPTLLYPGSLIHLTPSFFFQHVVYVDRAELAAAVFAQTDGVLDVINRRRRYRQRPFVRFLPRDFGQPLPLRDASFTVVLSLYTVGGCPACTRYLEPGGLVLTDDHHEDAVAAAAIPDLELEAVVEERRGKVGFRDRDLDGYLVPAAPSSSRRRGQPQASYLRSADYYLFRKRRHPLPT